MNAVMASDSGTAGWTKFDFVAAAFIPENPLTARVAMRGRTPMSCRLSTVRDRVTHHPSATGYGQYA